MADAKTKRFGRLLRVRTLQLTQVQGAEAAAHAKLDSESQLRARIAQLADNIAPQHAEAGFANTMAAAAHYRDRLHTSAVAATQRVQTAELGVERARAATREARRDQSAIEKLIVRAEADAALKALRALEEAPPIRKNRHDPC